MSIDIYPCWATINYNYSYRLVDDTVEIHLVNHRFSQNVEFLSLLYRYY